MSTSLQDSVGPDPIPPADEAVAEFEQERRTTPVELLWDLVFAVGLWAPSIASWGAPVIVTGMLAAVCVVDAVRLVSPR